MSLINSSYFVGEINLPSKTANDTVYTQAINQYEPEILQSLLGYELYSKLIADLDSEGSPVSDRFKALVNGAEFTINDRLIKWNGLVNNSKQSLIAYYVFYKITERTTTHITSVGNKSVKAEGTVTVSPMDKMLNAWEKMRLLYGIIPAAKMDNVNHYHYNYLPTAFNFLLANIETYPEWLFVPIASINYFGI